MKKILYPFTIRKGIIIGYAAFTLNEAGTNTPAQGHTFLQRPHLFFALFPVQYILLGICHEQNVPAHIG